MSLDPNWDPSNEWSLDVSVAENLAAFLESRGTRVDARRQQETEQRGIEGLRPLEVREMPGRQVDHLGVNNLAARNLALLPLIWVTSLVPGLVAALLLFLRQTVRS